MTSLLLVAAWVVLRSPKQWLNRGNTYSFWNAKMNSRIECVENSCLHGASPKLPLLVFTNSFAIPVASMPQLRTSGLVHAIFQAQRLNNFRHLAFVIKRCKRWF